ncbi:MAG: response regulator [Anaerolineae bacterium]|nr:response regulator [Anaerolineae bacterium]
MTTILIIEDDPALREEVIGWLMFEDYEALEASDGREGLKLTQEQLPDLILCDITMPNLDGYGVILEIRANPLTAQIPFIFLTARASHEDVRKGMLLGADDYLTKPFSRVELLKAIQIRLKKKELEEDALHQQIEMLTAMVSQEREQRLLKSRIVSMFSHDFRNSLATILASSGLLKTFGDQLDSVQRQRTAERIEGSVRRLMQMLDDMLVLAEMESGRFKFSPQRLDVNALIASIVEEFQFTYQESHTIHFESQVSKNVAVDPQLIHQIVSNLISNAIKYSPSGSTVEIVLTEDNGLLQLRVQDFGIGIPPNEQGQLFELFHRASNVGKIKGTGLGLAIVKQAIDLHGGKIMVDSTLNQGTQISVSLPIAS